MNEVFNISDLENFYEYEENGDGTYTVLSIKNKNSLEAVVPERVTAIEDEAFSGCESLLSVTIPASVRYISSTALDGCPKLVRITVHDDNRIYRSIDGNLYNKAGTVLIRYAAGKRGSFVIPEGVINIGDGAFSDSTLLTAAVLPKTVTAIVTISFSYCESLSLVKLTDSVTSIGEFAFNTCYSLTSIYIPQSVGYIGYGAFRDCDSLQVVRCQADEQPEKWHEEWIDEYTEAEIFWGE